MTEAKNQTPPKKQVITDAKSDADPQIEPSSQILTDANSKADPQTKQQHPEKPNE